MIRFLMNLFRIGRNHEDEIKVEETERDMNTGKVAIKITSNRRLSDDELTEIIKRYL